MKKKVDVVIIGAGAAGLFCAYEASKNSNLNIVLLEHNKQVGRKILISGGGRCNFTNIHSSFADFQSNNMHFFKSALSRFSPYDFIDLIEKYEIPYHEKKLGQLFCDKSAKDIVNMLLDLIDRPNVELRLSQKVTKVEDHYLIHANDDLYECDHLVVATGGLSIPPIGATDFGYKIAKKFGHKIIPCEPALVPFKFAHGEDLAGVSLLARVQVGQYEVCEDVLFTHKGFSGPAILKASLYWHSKDSVRFQWQAGIVMDEHFYSSRGEMKLTNALKEGFPARFVDSFIKRVPKLEHKREKGLTEKDFQRLNELFFTYEFVPSGTEGFRKAEVTRGGVDVHEVSSKNLESQLSSGLYFIGEVLDVTGLLGGFNFQWAWASAYCCGAYLATSRRF